MRAASTSPTSNGSPRKASASHALMVGQGLVGEVNRLGRLRLDRVDAFLQDMVKVGLYKPGEVGLAQVASERFAG